MPAIQVSQLREGRLLRDGAGVKLHRYIGAERGDPYEPILLFDYFDSEDPMDYLGGFPAHPHRGFETITYLLQGQMQHQDNKGHQGVIHAGGIQWMTAGSGIIHSEMPMQVDGHLQGIQLWLNLPAVRKMCLPSYQEFTAKQLPVKQNVNGIRIKVIAGEAEGICSPVSGIATEPLFLDIFLPSVSQWQTKIAKTHQSMVFILSGELLVEEQVVISGQLAILGDGQELTLQTREKSAHALLVSAKKLHEPIARLGPFVMNTDDEIAEAMADLRNQRL